MASHRHHIVKKNEFDNPWKLHRLFRNPKVKQVLIGCEVCHPRKRINVKKVERVYDLEVD